MQLNSPAKTQLRFVFLNFSFVSQNISACLKFNRPRLAINVVCCYLSLLCNTTRETYEYIPWFVNLFVLSRSEFYTLHYIPTKVCEDQPSDYLTGSLYCAICVRYHTDPVCHINLDTSLDFLLLH